MRKNDTKPAPEADQRLRNLAVAALVVGATATALNPVFVRLSDLQPGSSAFHRMAWALPIMWAWMMIEKKSSAVVVRKPGRGDRWLLVLCGIFFAADLIALHWSIQLTAVANAILFLNAQPIYVVLGAWLLFGERVSRRFLAGVAIALAGAVLMLSESADLGGGRLLGDGLGIISQAGGQGFIVWALAHLSTSFSSVALLSAPVASALFAWIFLSEVMGTTEIAGILVVLFGIYMAHRGRG